MNEDEKKDLEQIKAALSLINGDLHALDVIVLHVLTVLLPREEHNQTESLLAIRKTIENEKDKMFPATYQAALAKFDSLSKAAREGKLGH